MHDSIVRVNWTILPLDKTQCAPASVGLQVHCVKAIWQGRNLQGGVAYPALPMDDLAIDA